MRSPLSAAVLRNASLCALLVVMLTLVLVACSGPEDSESPTEIAIQNTVGTAPPSGDPATETPTLEIDDPTNTSVVGTATTAPTSTPSPTMRATVTPEPTDTPPPTRTPRARATPTQQPVAREFVDPLFAVYRAYEELTGETLNSQREPGMTLVTYAPSYPWIFAFATADVGEYNADTNAFYPWLKELVRRYVAGGGPAYVDSSSPAHDLLLQQMYTALYEPASPIGRFIRDAERQAYTVNAANVPLVFMIMLLNPTLHERNSNVYLLNVMHRQLANDVQNFLDFQRSRGTFVSFCDFLASLQFDAMGAIDLPGAEAPPTTEHPSPTATTGQTSTSGDVPSPGATLYDRSLTEWMTGEFEAGWFEVVGGEFHIGAWEGTGREWGRTHAAWTNEAGYVDIGASVSMRAVNADSSGGCIAVRQDPNAGEYNFCMLSNGRTWATYDAIDANGEWHQEVLLPDQQRAGSNAPDAWNRLTIVARGDQLWFLVNNVLQGTVRHGGRSAGAVAIQVTNWAADSAEWAFRDLIIQEVR